MTEPLDLAMRFALQHPLDTARLLETLTVSKTCEFLMNVPDNGLAQIISRMSAAYAASCIPSLPTTARLSLFKQMELQSTIEIFRYLSAKEKHRLLNRLPFNKRIAVQALNKYSQNSVGAWMNTDYIVVREDTVIEDVIEMIRGSKANNQDYVYLVNSRRQFIAAVRTSLLLNASLQARISAIKNISVDHLQARASIQDMLDHQGWRHHHVLPVVEHDNLLVGVMPYSSLNTAIEQSHIEFNQYAASVGSEALNFFGMVFHNFLQLLTDLTGMILKKNL